ncbi:uncharacterized protein GlcG (DUF336 family) [Arthrobacter sp. CAN_A2]|uniref:GlcG/HbpS family heme-binding protein n=1 Tax=Arthrobacter sp. CAN_A2 TaxID=2787718 RepID=UPI0018EFC06D
MDAGRQRGFKPLTVVVLDAGGHVTAAARQDGASSNRFEIAHGKAYGALALGMGSRAVMERAEQQASSITAAAVGLSAQARRFVPQTRGGNRITPVPSSRRSRARSVPALGLRE